MSEDSVSLNKFISSTGICSRREADVLIESGVVTINGTTAKKGNRVFANDAVKIRGKRIHGKKSNSIYIMLHKPPGITCTTDRREPSNIIDFINFKHRIFPIGRLDKSSTGLILLTNNGDIVNQILRKENKHEKEYVVTVNKPITKSFLNQMRKPIPILGTKTLPSKIKQINETTFKIILTQGLNRQIRRMCEYCGYAVVTLKRIRIMNLHLGKLKKGQWRHLSTAELKKLRLDIKAKS